MAIAGMAAAAARGLDVPGDLSVTGFDDTELTAHLQPALTTVRTDAYAGARPLPLQLMAVIDGRDTTNVGLSPPQLVVRASTAPPRTSHPSHHPETENS